MKRILVLGATGLFGKALVKKLLENEDCEIIAFSRHSKKIYADSKRLTAVNGDATKAEDLIAPMNGVDVVYCAVSGESLPTVAKTIVKVMPLCKVSRLLFMGAVGIYNEIPVELDDDDNVRNNPEQIPNLEAVEIIEKSDLNYTILRHGYLQDGDEDDYSLTFKGEKAKGFESTISSVIKIAVELIADDALYSRQSVGITKNQQ